MNLGLTKNWVKALDKDTDAFWYLQNIFPNITEEKLKQGIFVGPQIHKLMINSQYENILSVIEKFAWNSKDGSKNVIKDFVSCTLT